MAVAKKKPTLLNHKGPSTFEELEKEIKHCERCPRLRSHCLKVAKEKRRQFEHESYFALPIPGFGDPKAKVLIVGLAPAAHGANRTGRMFTGDNSGLWLYRALFEFGFSNKEESLRADDDLKIKNVFITAVARCAPPENKLLPEEILNCRPNLQQELAFLKNIKVILVLGQVALKGLWGALPKSVTDNQIAPKFSHGMQYVLNNGTFLLASYHPSQQNTFTRKLTKPMFDSIFSQVSHLLYQ